MLNQNEFFLKYNKVENAFKNSGLKWSLLEAIYDDYVARDSEMKKYCEEYEKYILKSINVHNVPIHSIRCRAKMPEHLIEKIIRKRGIEQNHKYIDICVENYLEIIRDLVGIRILILSKEEWEKVFDWCVQQLTDNKNTDVYMAEPPVAYTRYGDRDIFRNKINKEHTNKGYRSQHYVVRFKDCYCEIQVRTLAEEVFGEFDHRVKYPYRNDNNFLRRYSSSISQLLDSVDEIISTCFQMGERGWDKCNQYYNEDLYVDWQHVSQSTSKNRDEIKTKECLDKEIDVSSHANKIILRKE